tara:strand:+ start:281 stop:562 length:282 start_codon:yes stop_codon:yes gene_type:complete
MKKQRKQNHKQLKRKHAKAVARKHKGAQYGASVKHFGQLKKLIKHEGSLVTGIGTGVSEINSPGKADTQFVDDPTQTLKDKMAKADQGTIDIS